MEQVKVTPVNAYERQQEKWRLISEINNLIDAFSARHKVYATRAEFIELTTAGNPKKTRILDIDFHLE